MALILALGLSACAGSAKHPADALSELTKRVEAHDADGVYEMLGEKLRQGMTKEEFRDYFEANYEEIAEQAQSIDAALATHEMEIIASLPMKDKNELALRYEEDRWVFDEDVPNVVGASDPNATLLALSDAIENQDLYALTKLLTRTKSGTLRAELDIIAAGLRQVEEEDIVVSGENATVYLEWGLKLELKLEDGAWRIDRLAQ